ncbi:hypothetical protein COLO4_33220 [Corchorus olitorius]|uniref:Uncharacterized protein n=1 Tax=Corchorus olitorius TaxID=93759 RepID=A0A1R3GVJ3_9ROSI|nr:hypothetical protein COLO4_33220 [Corchorus olitorius]
MASSFLPSGRQGVFRNHVDSMLLQRKPVARALMAPDISCEIISKFGAKQIAGNQEEVEVQSKREGKMPIGSGVVAGIDCAVIKEKTNVLVIRGKALNEGGPNNHLKSNSGPTLTDQLYAKIPNIGPITMG